MVRVEDDEGRLVPDAVVSVSFFATGMGEVAAVGNVSPKDVGSFRQLSRDTFHGTCIVVLRPVGKPGETELRADSPRLGYTTMRLDVAK